MATPSHLKQIKVHIIKLFSTLLHLFKKALIEIVGVYIDGFMTLVLVLPGFRTMNGKNTLDNLTYLLCSLKNNHNKNLKCLKI